LRDITKQNHLSWVCGSISAYNIYIDLKVIK
jgi:hypothetical protein